VGIEPFVAFGELDGHLSQRVEGLRGAFGRAGVAVNVPADIQSVIWQKFIFIAAISGVGAVTRVPIGIVRSVPETRRMLADALDEVEQVAIARGVHVPVDLASSTLALIDEIAPAVIPSMQRDVMDGRPSELESQSGAVVRLGREAGVETPVHAFIYASLLPQELKARGELNRRG